MVKVQSTSQGYINPNLMPGKINVIMELNQSLEQKSERYLLFNDILLVAACPALQRKTESFLLSSLINIILSMLLLKSLAE